MLVLFETAAGFAVFKLLDEQKLQKVDNLFEDFEDSERASKVVQLKNFSKFETSADALEGSVALNEGKLCKPLKKLLKKVFAQEAHEKLAVWDAKLGGTIKENLGIQCVSNSNVAELMRCIKSQVQALIPGLQEKELAAMSLGLGHNLSRYKLKFSPDKVDTMIVQAISLLDDIDKELNNYVMRAREWYGWHFPELSKIITDNSAYINTIIAMGTRDKAHKTDFSHILPEDVEQTVKEAAEISMGSEVADDDINNILHLCEQILELTDYRAQLNEYLTNRMVAIAPNLTILVGELIGARLISHAGSLINLAKHPASTIQILGAEKALFRALKTRSTTPKFGMIYHAQMVASSSMKNKGKVSRMLAAKAALACRYDALGEETTTEMGMNNRAKLVSRVSLIEEGFSDRISGKGKAVARFEKYEGVSDIKQYSAAADSTLTSSSKRKFDESFEAPSSKKIKVEGDEAVDVSEKKKKKKKKSLGEELVESPVVVKTEMETGEGEGSSKKKKKKKSLGGQEEAPVVKMEALDGEESPEKKKKKKKKSLGQDASEAVAEAMKTEPENSDGSPDKKKKKKKSKEAKE